jgi:serine/threonine protein kinase
VVTAARFEIVRRLGEGGMGVVYEALDRERGARVALKKLRNFSAEALVRFKNEFRALQDLHHPNLVHLGELISEGDDWLFTMELVEGCDFLEYVRRGAREDSPSTASPTTKLAAIDVPASAAGSDATVSGPVHRAPSFAPDEPTGFDEQRLRDSLRQVAEGLHALHEAGLVHRDVKPSNIRVTPEGRVIVLDFGLVAESGRARPSATIRLDKGDREAQGDEWADLEITGTPAYMAPEQVTDESLEPSTDWYAVGVLLYEALTGSVPFRGPALYVLQRKLNADAVPARRMAPGVPPDLDDLCTALLRRDPRARPTGDDVLRRLSADSGRRDVPADSLASHASHAGRPVEGTFVGRASELRTIARAFADVQRLGAPVSVVVRGESGVGKSRLVKRFLDGVRQDEHRTLVLVGRCYERESVPYKAFDGVIDTLARELARRADDQVAALLPGDLAAIVHVFPVLQGLPAAAPLRDRPAMDPIELRRRAFAALRELLARLTRQAPVVVAIDDVQWADDDSRALVADLLRPPDAPQVLLVVTLRTSGGAREEATRNAGFADALPGDVRRVEMTGLAPADARELAARLLERAGFRAAESAAAIAREAEGHPLFMDALIRHDALSPGDAARAVHLEEALWSRIAPLEEPARAILALLAVSGGPISHDVLHRAVADRAPRREAESAPGPNTEVARSIAALRFAHLVQTAGSRGTDRVDVYHDRVRATVLAHLEPRERRELHQRLARSLELAGTADAEALATHWRGAGELVLAAKYAYVAGDRAAAALAFERAAHFYELALSLREHPDAEARILQRKLGDALANVGRAALAANAYQRAAEGAPAATALDLRRRAAEQLLRGGHFDAGLAEIQGVLASIGMSLPSTPRRAFLLLVLLRLILRLRGLRFRERDESRIAPRDLTRIDVCSSAATGLGLIDTIRAAALQSRHILLALRAGEQVRVARALAMETINVATGGGATWRRTESLMARAEVMAERTGRRDVVGLATFSRGFVHYMNGKFRRGFELLDESHRIMRSECAGMSFETVSAQWAMLNCLTYLGELDELRARRPVYLREAAARGDLYGVVSLRLGPGNVAWLVTDDVDEAREEVADAMRRWSKQGFHIEHFNAMFARVGVELYSGRGAEAFDLVMRDWPALRSSVFLSIQIVRVVARIVRGLAAIAAAEARPAAERGELLTIARRDARRLEGERVGWATAQARVLRAGVALLRKGDAERARGCLEQAAAMFDANGMALHAAAARRRLGRLLGGANGAALENEATAWMTERGIRNPSRMTALVVPGADAARW